MCLLEIEMSDLSIFVDESGDFGDYEKHSPYYIVSMIIHDQDQDISPEVKCLDQKLQYLGYKPDYVIHTAPLIRREEENQFEPPNKRRAVFTKLFYFVMKSPIQYKTFVFEKRQFENIYKLEASMARTLSSFIRENLAFFQSFDNIILYYDNGQHELSRILNTILATELSSYDVRKVLPKDYRLFQAADLICTLTLLELKCESGQLTRSEELIFHTIRRLKKDFIKLIRKKLFRSDE